MKTFKKLLKILLLLFVVVLLFNIYTIIVYGLDDSFEPKVIMVIINRVDFKDLCQMDILGALIKESGIALMNTRAAGQNNEFKSYATLGWGTRAEAALNTSTFYHLDKNIKAIYNRRTGYVLNGNGIVNININQLIDQNNKSEFKAFPGILGQKLRGNGYKTAVLGTSDIGEDENRGVGLISMDSHGYIDYGNIKKDLILEDDNCPFGIKTDYNKLLASFNEIYHRANFIVIETGDTNRLDRYEDKLTRELYELHKDKILLDIDNFLGQLVESVDYKTTLMVVTPYPSNKSGLKGQRLTPIIIHNKDLGQGLLWSSTTRRAGIIGNVDIAPTILSFFDIRPSNMVGKQISIVPNSDNINYINLLNRRIVNTSQQRYRVLYTFAVFQILVSISLLIIIVLGKRISQQYHRLISKILIATIIVPLTLLILPIFGVNSVFVSYILIIVISWIIVELIYKTGHNSPINIVFYSSVIMMVALLLDISTGQNLIKNSILGYDPVIGARYYGLGNEYMGILIGSTLISTTALIERFNCQIKYIFVLYILVIFSIGFPLLGANIGGLITAIISFSFTIINLLEIKISKKSIAIIVSLVIITIAMIALIDISIIKSPTHLANVFYQMVDKGPIIIYEIIIRKLTMNIRIMKVTIWSRVLLSAILILAILFYKPNKITRAMGKKYPNLIVGWRSIVLACVVSFLVNDSGVVAAATTIIYLSTSSLYILVNDTNKSKN